MKSARLAPLFALLLLVSFAAMPSRLSAQTTIAQWNFNGVNNATFTNANVGTGTMLGYGQGVPSVPLSSVLVNGTPTDPGTLASGTNYNRSASVNPPLLTAANLSVGVMFAAPTTGFNDAIKISWSQTVGFRSSRFWQILVSTNGTSGAFFAPSGGTGSSISETVNGYNSTTNLISGTATVEVSATGLIDFRTINGNWLSQAVTTTGTITNPLAAGFLDDISYMLPTGQGYENNANFAFAIVGAWDPSLGATSGTNGLVSSFAGLDSTNLTDGYNRALGSGGGMRLDLMTVTAVPEPSTIALLATAALLIAGACGRKRKRW